MKETIFRGLTRRYGERVTMAGVPFPSNWTYGMGCLHDPESDFAIIYNYTGEALDKTPVYAATCSQYIGINDKDGNKIFEGDIVVNDHGERFVIEETVQEWGYRAVSEKNHDRSQFDVNPDGRCDQLLVIGNVYDEADMRSFHEKEDDYE